MEMAVRINVNLKIIFFSKFNPPDRAKAHLSK